MLILKKILFLLSFNKKRNFFFLILVISLMAVADIIGLISILPFIALLSNPNLIETNYFLSTIYQYGNFKDLNQFIFVIGLFVFFLFIFSLIFKAFSMYFRLHYGHMREFVISEHLIQGYLRQPYSSFLNQNSIELSKNILSEVSKVVGSCILPFLELISQLIVLIILIVLLVILDPFLTLNIIFIFSFSYFLIYKFIKKFLDKIGILRLISNKERFSIVHEIFGAFKEVKLGSLEESYLKRFSNSAQIFSKNQAYSEIIARIPRFILEAISLGGLLLITLFLMKTKDDFSNIIPILTLYALIGYRLLPAAQLIYFAFVQIHISLPALNLLYKDLQSLKFVKKENFNNTKADFKILSSISLDNINFMYPDSNNFALKNINLLIPVKNVVGIVGLNGSGKSTIVNILLGLLKPQIGNLKVDNKIIDGTNLRAWQKSIGYVPQQIYLTDNTIASNIAFGVEKNKIDKNRLKKTVRLANLEYFIEKELPLKYETIVGENGIRISGGQKQRIAIARALYHEPDFLIFDEATSAVDNISEKLIVNSILEISSKITILIIAHRLSTIKLCNKLYHLEKGKIICEGSYKKLKVSNKKFKNIINAVNKF